MLRLAAADEDDLTIVSTQMQDALVRRADMAFDAKRRRFALVANRFAWDATPAQERRRAGLYFDDVERVQSICLTQADGDAVLSLLAIGFTPGAGLAGQINLSFSANIGIRLTVSCINASMADIGGVWATAQTPTHSE